MKRNPVAWAALIVASAALVSSSGLLRSMPAAPRTPLEGQQSAKALSQAYVAVAEFARPSVVQIMVQKKGTSIPMMPGNRRFQIPPRGNDNRNAPDLDEMLRRFFEGRGVPEKEQFSPRRAMGIGSGFVYDNRGHILTNNHVVENAEKIKVFFYDGVEASAKIVGTDNKTDVAVIQVENTSYPALPKGDSGNLKVGEMVMAFGSPFSLSQSVTAGIVSALNRNHLGINGNPQDTYEAFIQTDAAINRGNSGGPLLNMNGEVIGINSAIVTGSGMMGHEGGGNDGIGFAIPIKMASSVADLLIRDGKVHYVRIGVVLEPLGPAQARQLGLEESTKGVLVNQVLRGSPAEKAGLKQGDVIVGFAGDKVVDGSSFRLKVATSEASKPYELVYFREGTRHQAQIVPMPAEKVVFEKDHEENSADEPKDSEPAKTNISGFGLEVQPLTAEIASALNIPTDLKGVVVSSVKPGSPADAAGIEPGFVITRVIRNRRPQPLTSVQQLQDLASKNDELGLYVQMGNASRLVVLTKHSK